VSLVGPAALGPPRSSVAQLPGRIERPDDVSVDGLKRLRRAFGDGRAARCHPDRTDAADAGVVELLAEREMQVLGLMAAGSSNPQIADEGVVVLDTVKKHVVHILDKLGAANRTQAVARARVVRVAAVELLRSCRSGHLEVPSRREDSTSIVHFRVMPVIPVVSSVVASRPGKQSSDAVRRTHRPPEGSPPLRA
jgi:DNA-binding CsgD family transcriptional regulator